MNLAPIIPGLSSWQPVAWLALVLVLYLGGRHRYERQQKHGIGPVRADEQPPSYQALGLFAGLRLAGSLAYPLLQDHALSLPLSAGQTRAVYLAISWGSQFLSAVCALFVLSALLSNSLRGDPRIEKTAQAIYRWAAGILLCIALTANLQLLGEGSLQVWLGQARISMLICVGGAEICLLALLLSHLNQMGLCLRSRPVGIAFGLAVLSCLDLAAAAADKLAPNHGSGMKGSSFAGSLCVVAFLAMYVILPEPARRVRSLTSGQYWMNWKEISQRLSDKRPVPQRDAFISEVEVIVDGVLDKHHIRPMH